MATKNFHDEEEIVIPKNAVELADFLSDLWEDIFENDQTDKIELYNQAAKQYNTEVRNNIMELIINFKNQKNMATKKAAVKKTATKKAAPAKKAAVKKTGEKKVSQKTQIVELAAKGKSIDQIVEITGIQKANVQWYFSKLKLGK